MSLSDSDFKLASARDSVSDSPESEGVSCKFKVATRRAQAPGSPLAGWCPADSDLSRLPESFNLNTGN